MTEPLEHQHFDADIDPRLPDSKSFNNKLHEPDQPIDPEDQWENSPHDHNDHSHRLP